MLAESGYNGLFRRIALPDKYGVHIGGTKYLRGKFGLDSVQIASRIEAECKGRRR